MLNKDLPKGSLVICVDPGRNPLRFNGVYSVALNYQKNDNYVTVNVDGETITLYAYRFKEAIEALEVGEMSRKYIRLVVESLGHNWEEVERSAEALEAADKLKDNEDFKKFVTASKSLGVHASFNLIHTISQE